MSATSTPLDDIGPETWTGLVRRLLDDDRAEVLRLQHDAILIGAGTGTRLYRTTGSATSGGRSTDWSLVIKAFTTEHMDFESMSDDPSAWDYWKREWLVYQAPWFADLTGPLVPPRCLGAAEIHSSSGPFAWLALEDLGDVSHQWPLHDFAEVAFALGEFGGRYLTGTARPTDPWLTDRWLVGWSDRAGDAVAALPAAAQHPDAGRIYPPEVGTTFTALWENRHRAYAALDELPTIFAHNDVFPRNLHRRPLVGGRPQNVAIDWAFCGAVPVGSDLAPLVGATMAFFGSPPDAWDELERVCLEGYRQGLRSMGWAGSAEDLRLGYLTSLVLRYGLGSLPPIIGLSMFVEDKDVVRAAFGCSFEEFVANCGAATQFLRQRALEVQAALGL